MENVGIVTVGIAEMKAARSPVRLSVIGLGSCVGVCLYDPVKKLGGIAHVMLPDSSRSRGVVNNAKFADTAVVALKQEMVSLGARPAALVAKIAGGAQMFLCQQENNTLRVGEHNCLSVKKALEKSDIPLLAEDCGGNFGRTIILETASGCLYVKTIYHGEQVI